MPSLTPCPLAPNHPLAAIAALAPNSELAGVWVRGICRLVGVRFFDKSRRCRSTLLLSADLGRLLRSCPSIVVRVGGQPLVMSADALIRVRALRIIAGVPYIPSAGALGALFPGARHTARVAEVPLCRWTAEEVLAACAGAGVPILRSTVVYRPIPDG